MKRVAESLIPIRPPASFPVALLSSLRLVLLQMALIVEHRIRIVKMLLGFVVDGVVALTCIPPCYPHVPNQQTVRIRGLEYPDASGLAPASFKDAFNALISPISPEINVA